jgi:hypothetical protein
VVPRGFTQAARYASLEGLAAANCSTVKRVAALELTELLDLPYDPLALWAGGYAQPCSSDRNDPIADYSGGSALGHNRLSRIDQGISAFASMRSCAGCLR